MSTDTAAGENAEERGTGKVPREGKMTPDAIQSALEKRGHLVTSLDEIGGIEVPTGAIATMYKVGLPSNENAPTIFNMWFPPGCTIEVHTHACDYSEIIIEGSQKVGGKWLYPGDIRIGLANEGYGPLVAGPEGARVLVTFANGQWPGVPLDDNDGGTLATPEITDRFEPA